MKKLLFIIPIMVSFIFSVNVQATDIKTTQIPGTNIYTDAKNTKKVLKIVEKAQSFLPEKLLELYDQEGVQIYYLENGYIEKDANGSTFRAVDGGLISPTGTTYVVVEPVKIYIYSDPDYTVLLHEYGHALDYIWGYKNGNHHFDTGISNTKSWTLIYNQNKETLKEFREYGLKNKKEGFAESFMFHFLDPDFAKKASSLNYYVTKIIQESEGLLEE